MLRSRWTTVWLPEGFVQGCAVVKNVLRLFVLLR